MSVPSIPSIPSIPSVAGGGGGAFTQQSLSLTGDLITDAVREAGVQGDGLTPPAGVSIWPEATNLVTNGGFETNTTGWAVVGSASLARITSDAKFGSACLEVTNTAQNDGTSFTGTGNAGQNDPYALSCWVKAKAAGDVGKTIQLFAQSVGGSFEFLGFGGGALTADWQRFDLNGTWANASHTGYVIVARGTDATPGSFLLDGVQYEAGSIATPYIETDGGTASRTAGRVFDDANLIEIDAEQFAVAVRWNPGIANTGLSTGTAVLFEKVVDASNLVRGLYDWSNNRYELQRVESGSGSPHTKAHTFTAQSSQTVIFQGTPTGLTISVGGDFDAETANTATPDVSSADLDYGSTAGTSAFLDGNDRFIATFTGTLSNANAASIAAMPSPPSWAQLVGALPATAGVDTLWPCVNGTFLKAS